jgi:hypothetical protein
MKGAKVTAPAVSDASTAILRNSSGRFLPGTAQPARRTRGAQLGNLNAARDPWKSYWRRRALRKQDAWVRPLIDSYGEGLIADKGGLDAMSNAEIHMAELAALARGVLLLILAQAASTGGLAGPRRSASIRGGNLSRQSADPDLAAHAARFMKIEAGALQALGLQRRAKPVPSLSQALAAVNVDVLQ